MVAHLGVLTALAASLTAIATPIPRDDCNATLSTRQVSPKRGFSWPGQEGGQPGPAAQLTEHGVLTWFWNWGLWKPDIPHAPEFVGQLWSDAHLKDLDGGNCPSLILGFNEPDIVAKGIAASMTVERAAKAWREAKRLCPRSQWASPAITGPHSIDWLRRFFDELCPAGLDGCLYAPEYINFHTYQPNVEWLKNDVEAMKVFGRPLILSEFACHDFSGQGRECKDVMAFAREALEFLDNDDMVYRYAWFGAMAHAEHLGGVSRVNMLIEDGGVGLTPLGKLYVGLID